jgi:flagellar biosynthesis protein FlhA
VLLDVMFTFNIVLALMVILVSVSAAAAGLLGLPDGDPGHHHAAADAERGVDPRGAAARPHGTAAAGHVIEAFGNVVIGGNFVVGIVVFVILMIINFVVVTKGAERISEVSARFTLDACRASRWPSTPTSTPA